MKIAIYGPMCSGKSTIASIINEYDNRYKIYSFGQRIKDLAIELFDMEGKNRSLLITIADQMREIDKDVWVKYIMKQVKDKDNCIIDDLRFQNELNYLEGWKIICLTTPDNIRIDRIKELYPDSYEDHIKNMSHLSETDTLKLPKDTLYVSSDIPIPVLKRILLKELKF
tara:strand:- start:74 stop:580 length:507 start_codon:yes stop_codon:yes gene_type:complete